jgi:4-diphosphocytidyl-2-C-methyl-D-erythritol kinase
MKGKPEARSCRACAKINLTFEVTGKRGDGYHEIVSVMQAIDLCDALTFEPRESLYLSCNIPELVSPNNLIFKAARLMESAAGRDHGVAISLTKGIPPAGGLGGGSSDAAAVLQSLNELWKLDLPWEKLGELAARLGSDVPFFCCGSTTALARGRGDRVAALPALRRTWIVLAVPAIQVADKTRRMYARLDASRFTDGRYAERMAGLIQRGESVVSELCYNAFDDVAYSFFPGLDRYRLAFLAAGAGEVHVAGAGPVLFAIAEDRAGGLGIVEKLKRERIECYLVGTLS